ncbi:hypothetical protein EZS27_027503 [termite gut metagenome]|uniref:Uncharacterized protein n=1 Tax=termite gut metagenome TaxID=433724 RepID=A0A5J4QM60_9ZZZZ
MENLEKLLELKMRTLQFLIGEKSLQFRFVNSKTNPSTVPHNVTYNTTTKVLTSPAGILQHMTLGISSITSSHAANEYKFWDMALYNSPPLADATKKYYLYAKVSKTVTTGVFLLSETAIDMDSVAGHYHLLTGILNSEYEGERSYIDLYGFTEVLPERLTEIRDRELRRICMDLAIYEDRGGNIDLAIRFANTRFCYLKENSEYKKLKIPYKGGIYSIEQIEKMASYIENGVVA